MTTGSDATAGERTAGGGTAGAPGTAAALDAGGERQLEGRPWIQAALSQGLARVRSGDLGVLPIVVGIALVWTIFGIANPVFLSSTNLDNLLVQSSSIGTIALGVVLVLLVAEIDLSVGSMSGVGSSIVGVGLALQGWSVGMAVAVALLAGLAVGLIYSAVFIRFQVPSFVITLAGLLALLGVQLILVGQTGSINLTFRSALVRFMENDVLPPGVSYALVALIAGGYAGSSIARARRRAKAGLQYRSVKHILAIAIVLAAGLGVAVWDLNRAIGISDAFVLFVALVVVIDVALRRTHWGRAVYAVGGSREAASRAGINIPLVYVSVFVLCAMLSALGGVLEAGRLATASVEAGTGNVNLDAIAAAVIGGTSLFGGRGSAYSALLGIAIIESISNGLDLLNLSSADQFIITGAVLLIAVIVDAASHRARVAHGRA